MFRIRFPSPARARAASRKLISRVSSNPCGKRMRTISVRTATGPNGTRNETRGRMGWVVVLRGAPRRLAPQEAERPTALQACIEMQGSMVCGGFVVRVALVLSQPAHQVTIALRYRHAPCRARLRSPSSQLRSFDPRPHRKTANSRTSLLAVHYEARLGMGLAKLSVREGPCTEDGHVRTANCQCM